MCVGVAFEMRSINVDEMRDAIFVFKSFLFSIQGICCCWIFLREKIK